METVLWERTHKHRGFHMLKWLSLAILLRWIINYITSSSGDRFPLLLLTGKPLPNSLEWMSAPYSTVTSSSMLLTSLQNSFSTTSVGTICDNRCKRWSKHTILWPHISLSTKTIRQQSACPHCTITYMHRHVEVVSLEGISHFTKALQSVLLGSLFKAKGFRRPLTLLK